MAEGMEVRARCGRDSAVIENEKRPRDSRDIAEMRSRCGWPRCGASRDTALVGACGRQGAVPYLGRISRQVVRKLEAVPVSGTKNRPLEPCSIDAAGELPRAAS